MKPHPIQQHIIKKLILNRGLRYAELEPPGVTSNLFAYHLGKLVSEKIVAKTSSWYRLTAKGKTLVDKLSLETLEPRIQPKIVTLIACRNRQGNYLLYCRRKEPFFGLIGFPYGKIHLGETIRQAAEREFAEKTGLSATLTHRGNAYLTVSQEGELVSHMLAHVFSGENPRGDLKTDSEIGECFWQKPEKLKTREVIPGFTEILGLLGQRRSGMFFKEYFLDTREG